MKIDLYAEITNSIIESIEGGVMPWKQDWQSSGYRIPTRSNGDPYRGINILILWIRAIQAGFPNQQWMTYNQAKDLKGQVRKGEKGSKVVYFNFFEKEDEATGETKKIPMLKAFTVFNVSQIDGLPAKFKQQVDTGVRSDMEYDAIFAASGAEVVFTGGQPAYNIDLDRIGMPEPKQFDKIENYYATLAHELVHWTGHKSRLDRFDAKGSEAREEYAFEELVAELGACFLMANLGLNFDVDRSAAYVDNWLNAMKNDKKFIFKAASTAQKAVDFILEKAGLLTSKEAA